MTTLSVSVSSNEEYMVKIEEIKEMKRIIKNDMNELNKLKWAVDDNYREVRKETMRKWWSEKYANDPVFRENYLAKKRESWNKKRDAKFTVSQ